MKFQPYLSQFILAFLLLLSWNYGLSQPIQVSILDEPLFKKTEVISNKKIAFIDLSELQLGPHIVVVDLKGQILSRFPIPRLRFDSEWINWGPGITFDKTRQTIWYLAPKVGLTEFDLAGNISQTINFSKASHQIQRTDSGGFVLPYSWDERKDNQDQATAYPPPY